MYSSTFPVDAVNPMTIDVVLAEINDKLVGADGGLCNVVTDNAAEIGDLPETFCPTIVIE